MQMLTGKAVYFLTTSQPRILLKTSNRNQRREFYFNKHCSVQSASGKQSSPNASQLAQRQSSSSTVPEDAIIFPDFILLPLSEVQKYML